MDNHEIHDIENCLNEPKNTLDPNSLKREL